MGKKSNGKLRAARHYERVIRKGLDQVPAELDPYAYVYGASNAHLTQRNGASSSSAQKG